MRRMLGIEKKGNLLNENMGERDDTFTLNAHERDTE